MARVLVVGCGCRGRALAGALIEDGHAVRGTSRDSSRMGEIESAGAEAVVADPDRLGTLLPLLSGVSALCWLMGTASGPAAPALHGDRLRSLLEKLVDTPVRGLVYEEGGGGAIVREAAETWRMPVEVVREDPGSHEAWLAAIRSAVDRVLAA